MRNPFLISNLLNSYRIVVLYRPYCRIQAHRIIVSHQLFPVQRTHTNHLLLRVSILLRIVCLTIFLSIIAIQLKVPKSIGPI